MTTTFEPQGMSDDMDQAYLQDLIDKAQQGDRSVLPELRRLLDDNPQNWETIGDLAVHAREAWLNLLAGQNLVLYETTARKQAAMQKELAGPHPTPLERLLVERVAACWLQLYYAEMLYAQSAEREAPPGRLRDLMKRQESAERRYQLSIKRLAQIRKILQGSPLAIWPGQDATPAGAGREPSAPRPRTARAV